MVIFNSYVSLPEGTLCSQTSSFILDVPQALKPWRRNVNFGLTQMAMDQYLWKYHFGMGVIHIHFNPAMTWCELQGYKVFDTLPFILIVII